MERTTRSGLEKEILWNFKFQIHKQLPTKQADTVVVDKEQKRKAVIDVGIPCDSTIRKTERG